MSIETQDIKITPRLKRWVEAQYPISTDQHDDIAYLAIVQRSLSSGLLDDETFLSLQKGSDMTTTAEKVLGGGSGRVDLKDESSKYSTKRFEAKHAKLGTVFHPSTGRPAEHASQLDHAKAGVYLKHIASRSGLVNVSMPDDEKALLTEMAECDSWVGKAGGVEYDKLAGGSQVKSLLDDTASGGLEIAPIFFDDNVITFPLLSGELFPRVEVVNVPRGRRVEGASVGTPTLSWGQGDNVETPLLDTASLVNAIDTTVFSCAISVEVGRDFLSDAAVNVGEVLVRLVGERLQETLDYVIASGNGTSQPQGILTASGLSTATTSAGASGPPTVADYTELMFSIGKQYRNQAMRCSFLSNDTTFQRSRSVVVGAGDQRPVFSDINAFNQYSTLGWNHAIQNDVANTVCAFGAMSKYRLYRRAGLEIRMVDGGKELSRNNLILLVARARFGGKVMDANAFAKWTNGQS